MPKRTASGLRCCSFGEGWHNNHHAMPQSARHGLAWYEFDLNWYGICALRWLQLAWGVKLPKPVAKRSLMNVDVALNRGISAIALKSYSRRRASTVVASTVRLSYLKPYLN